VCVCAVCRVSDVMCKMCVLLCEVFNIATHLSCHLLVFVIVVTDITTHSKLHSKFQKFRTDNFTSLFGRRLVSLRNESKKYYKVVGASQSSPAL